MTLCAGWSDFLFKTLLVGPPLSGKTHFWNLLIHNKTEKVFFFLKNGDLILIRSEQWYVETIVEVNVVRGKNYKAQVWDTAGSEKFRQPSVASYRGARMVFFFVDGSRSLDDLLPFLEIANNNASSAAKRILVINNRSSDMILSKEEIDAFMGTHNFVRYFCVGSETSQRDLLAEFDQCVQLLIDEYRMHSLQPDDVQLLIDEHRTHRNPWGIFWRLCPCVHTIQRF